MSGSKADDSGEASAWERRLRQFLLAISILSFGGIALELWFADHDETVLQLIPFAVCAVGAASLLAVLVRPSRLTIWPARLLMLAGVGVSLLGLWEHFETNYGFERDIRPTASASSVLLHALHGSAPTLAPGSLALIAVLAIAATMGHPRLRGGAA